MSIALNINLNEMFNVIKKMDYNEQEKIAEFVFNLTYAKWFNDFRFKMKDIPVSIDEITELVEQSRNERYENSN